MKYTLKINTKDGTPIFKRNRIEYGTDMVEKIRDSLPNYVIPLESLSGEIPAKEWDGISIDVDEDIAINSGLFKTKQTIIIYSTSIFIYEYMFVEHFVNTYKTIDGVDVATKVCSQYKVNSKELLNKWESLNFPINL